MEEHNNCVYKHTSPSGKVYIGITCTTPSARWRNGSGYSSQPAIANAIKKYGWDNFSHEILAENLTREEATEKEQEYILLFKSNDPKYGYNCTSGGDAKFIVSETTKKKLSESKKRFFELHPEYLEALRLRVIKSYEDKTIQTKISNSMRRVWKDEEYRRRMSKAISDGGKRHYQQHPERSIAVGISAKERWESNEFRKRVCLAMRGIKKTETARANMSAAQKKPVLCVETQDIFPSSYEASVFAGVTKICVCDCCNAKQETAGGYHWRYTCDSEEAWNNKRKSYIDLNKSTIRKRVKCVETNIVYESGYAASIAMGRKSAPSIYDCCRGRRKTAYGFHWEYVD